MSRLNVAPQGLYDPGQEHDSCGVGFVVDIKGRRSHRIVEQALEVVINLLHRGACGCETNTGDGAGMLLQLPHRFLRKEAGRLGIDLPEPGAYGAGMVFLPRDRAQRTEVETVFERIVAEEGQQVLGWRTVPTDDSALGNTARSGEPVIRQILIGRGAALADHADAHARFERKLYVIRKRVARAVEQSTVPERHLFYVASLSSNTIVYKGMLIADQVEGMFPDLADPDVESALALVHQRFSTNTFPSWPLAHPYRYIAHNGEINTLRGNINWMRAREALCRSDLFGDDLGKLFPLIREGQSDTATFDNVLEFLVLTGRPLAHAVLMMIPEPWCNHESMSPERKAFYQYHASLMEPWDGPASIAFTDGTVIGAVLDRNGLRPSRYYVTKDDMVIMASEVGVLDVPPENVLVKERLHPGRIFLVDTAQGRIIDDEEIKAGLAAEHPYGAWLERELVHLRDLPPAAGEPVPEHDVIRRRQRAFGYTEEDLRILVGPMAERGVEPTGSMGTDTSLAVLSDRSRLLYDYFKQLFAQVTNPPLDAIREELVTDMTSTLGSERNLLDPEPASCHHVRIDDPVIDNHELAKLRAMSDPAFRSVTLPMLFSAADGAAGLERAMDELRRQASAAVAAGCSLIVLTDRGIDRDNAPIPSLLATAGVHHHLVREGTRTRCSLDRRIGRGARGAPHGAAAGVRRRRHQPLPRLRDAAGHGERGAARGRRLRDGRAGVHQGVHQGRAEGDVQDGHLHAAELPRRADLRGGRARQEIRRPLLHLDRLARRRHRHRHRGGRDDPPPPPGLSAARFARRTARHRRRVPVAAGRRIPPLQPGDRLQAAARVAQRPVRHLPGVRGAGQRPEPQARHAAGPVQAATCRRADPDRRGGAAREHPEAFRDRRHVVRLHQQGGARDAGHRHEPPGRQVEYRRGRRGFGALHARPERRPAAQRGQAGGLRALRGHQRVPGQLGRHPDQDGAGCEARRGRTAPGVQGVSVDSQGALLDAGRGTDLASAAPRHLLHRRPGAAHPRPEERQPARPHPREAGG